MALSKEDTWFKIAANPKGIKQKLAHHWRCFIVPEDTVVTMRFYTITGEIGADNFIPESTDEEGLDPRAWISVYGDVLIDDDGIGTFSVKNPPK